MSLRHFHIFFIALSLALLALLTTWSGMHGFPLLCAAGAAGLALGLPYFYWFLGLGAPGQGHPAPNA